MPLVRFVLGLGLAAWAAAPAWAERDIQAEWEYERRGETATRVSCGDNSGDWGASADFRVVAAPSQPSLAPPDLPQVLVGPVANLSSGHLYYLLTESTWTAAEAKAIELGGHLVTINDEAENQWVFDTFAHYGGTGRGLWIGLTDQANEGEFEWVDGTPQSFIRWAGGEPNNHNGGEDYAHIFFPQDGRAPGWNDFPDLPGEFAGIPLNGVVEVWEHGITVEPSPLTENSNNGLVIVQRLQNADLEATLSYGVTGGTATPGVDFVLPNGVLEFAAGVKTQSIPITILDDALVEGPETIVLSFTNAASGFVTKFSLTILDDDTGIEFESPAYSAAEGAGKVVLGVRRQDDSPDSATVEFATADGTAKAGIDYVTTSGNLTFAAGETHQEIVVPLLDDEVREPDKTFTVQLSRVTGGSALGVAANTTVTIQDDDLGKSNYYFTDFEHGAGSEWSQGATDVTPVGNRKFLGQFSNQTVSLNLVNLLAHTNVTVSFDLFIIQSWDGNDSVPWEGPDVWDLSLATGPTLLHTTFANWPGSPGQAYPGMYPGGNYPIETGAGETNSLGYSFGGDSVYYLVFTFPHEADSLRLDFSAMGLQDIGDESWGVDNVSVGLGLRSTNALYVKTQLATEGVWIPGNHVPVQRVRVSGNRAVAMTGDGQVHLVEVSNLAGPTLLGAWLPWFQPYAVALDGNFAYIATSEPGFLSTVEIVDFSNATKPVLRGYYDTAGSAQDLALAGNVLYVANGEGGLVILDVSNPALPRRIGGYDIKGAVQGIQVSGRSAYLACSKWLIVLDISDPANPRRIGLYEADGGITAMGIWDSRLYLAEGTGELRVLEVTDPRDIRLLGRYQGWGESSVGLAMSGSYLYLARGNSGVQVLEVLNPAKPAWVTGTPWGEPAEEVAVLGQRLLVAGGEKGLLSYELQQHLYPPLKPPVVSGSVLTLTWPAMEGVRLQQSTSLTPPIWHDVPGSDLTNTASLPVINAQVFFRLIKP